MQRFNNNIRIFFHARNSFARPVEYENAAHIRTAAHTISKIKRGELRKVRTFLTTNRRKESIL